MANDTQHLSDFKPLMDLVVIPTLLLDRDNKILVVNSEFCHLIQAPAGTLEGKDLDDILYPGDRALFQEFIQNLNHQPDGKGCLETRFKTNEDIVVRSLVSAGKINYDSKDITSIHAHDIQELHNLQDRLDFMEEFLHSIGDLVKIGTWEVDLDSNQLYWSPQTYEIHELDSDVQPKLDDAIAFYAPEAQETIRLAVENSVHTGNGFDVTLPLTTAKGNRIHVHAVGEVEKRDGHPCRLFGIFQDVTDQTEMREQFLRMKDGLAKVQRMEALGVMTSGIAHDFNNINASIQGNAEMLAARLNDDQSKEMMADIIDSCDHARNLVHRILAFTRNDQKQVRKKTSPHRIVSRAISMTRLLVSDGIEIEHDISQDLPEISVDPYQVEEALINLIYNAIQAIDGHTGKGKVSISAAIRNVASQDGCRMLLPGHYVVFSVEDDGPGISPDVIKDIFTPFFTTKSEENIGLGLPMVQEVMKAHGGAAVADHDRTQGAGFHLYFPADPEAPIPDSQKPMKSIRVLLIDDEAAFLKMMERALNSFGYQVNSYRSPLDGLRAYQEDPSAYDLVVTDLDLPWVDGNAVARQVREINSEIPIILVSGCNWKLDSSDSNFQNFTGILTKPFSLDDMQNTIADALKKKSP